MRVIGVIIFRLVLALTSQMTSRNEAAAAETLRRHDDVIVAPGRCLVRCLTLFQVRFCRVAQFRGGVVQN